MLDGQTNGTSGTRAPHAPITPREGRAHGPSLSGREAPGAHDGAMHEVSLSDPVRRLLDALAVYQVTRPGFGERVGRMGTLH